MASRAFLCIAFWLLKIRQCIHIKPYITQLGFGEFLAMAKGWNVLYKVCLQRIFLTNETSVEMFLAQMMSGLFGNLDGNDVRKVLTASPSTTTSLVQT